MPGPPLAAPLLAALLAAGPPGAAASPRVLVTGGDRFGAGIVWDGPAGHVLTALHVVEGVAGVEVSVDGAPPTPARVVDVEPALDLALLATAPLGAAAARASAGVACGEPVRLAGFPGLRAADVAGTVVDPARRFAGARYLEIAGVVEPGASGGPVLDRSGAVVGIVDLLLAGRGVTLAIPIDAAAARFPRPAQGAAPPLPPPSPRPSPPAARGEREDRSDAQLGSPPSPGRRGGVGGPLGRVSVTGPGGSRRCC